MDCVVFTDLCVRLYKFIKVFALRVAWYSMLSCKKLRGEIKRTWNIAGYFADEPRDSCGQKTQDL